jgi:GT2 family glycosyltransferase
VSQTRPPDEIIVSAPDPSHVEQIEHGTLRISYVFGREGTTAQRNQALDKALGSFDIVTFFDDDFLPADDYLEAVEKLFFQHPDWTVLTGQVVLDGANDAGHTIEEGLASLARAEAEKATREVRFAEPVGAYGCNMSMRTADIGDNRFDERLALYGWQEDIDFTRRIAKNGKIVRTSELIGVHLGHKAGRVSGRRLGYSQIANPVYLVRKGTMPLSFALELMGRNLAANVIKSFWPEPYVDRRGRFKGNLHALYHLLRGRIDPEYILKL